MGSWFYISFKVLEASSIQLTTSGLQPQHVTTSSNVNSIKFQGHDNYLTTKDHLPAPGMIVSWVHTYSDLSLGDNVILRQTRFSSLPWRFLTIVNSLTGWGSTPTALNLSTQYQVQNVRPAWGGNTLSPET